MPRLLTGKKSADAKRLSSVPTIFSRAKIEGFRSAAAGWHIDYCGALGKSIAECWSANMDSERNSMGLHPTEIAINQLRYLFESQFRSPFGQSIGTKRHILDYSIIMRGALTAASNPAFDLVFIHFPIPHPPLFYDRTTGRYDLGDRPLVSLLQRNTLRYLDGLELVDHTIAQIRRTLDSAGLWDRTHLIISSDHPARNRSRIDGVTNDPRVPFIIRVAGASQEIAYEPQFNTIVSTEVAIGLLRGEIHTPTEVRSKIEEYTAGEL
jgi:hypothetical protein